MSLQRKNRLHFKDKGLDAARDVQQTLALFTGQKPETIFVCDRCVGFGADGHPGCEINRNGGTPPHAGYCDAFRVIRQEDPRRSATATKLAQAREKESLEALPQK